jgi:hypothetical protein
MGIAIQAVGEGLREATHRIGGVALRRLRLPLPPSANQYSRRGSITRSRARALITKSRRDILPAIASLISFCGSSVVLSLPRYRFLLLGGHRHHIRGG